MKKLIDRIKIMRGFLTTDLREGHENAAALLRGEVPDEDGFLRDQKLRDRIAGYRKELTSMEVELSDLRLLEPPSTEENVETAA